MASSCLSAMMHLLEEVEEEQDLLLSLCLLAGF
jgi:hypothetical protein